MAACSGCGRSGPLEMAGAGMDAGGDLDARAAAPPVPALLAPSNGAATGSPWGDAPGRGALRPAFAWTSVADATRHEIEIDDDCVTPGFASCAFPAPEVTASVDANAYVPDEGLPVSLTPPVGRRYYWRVRACAATCSEWSAVRYVDVGRQRADFDGDGYADVLAGFNPSASSQAFEAYVYYGAPGGLPSGPSATLRHEEGEIYSWASVAVAALGDVDADGFADALLGVPQQDGAGNDAGFAHLYLGSASGLPLQPSATLAPACTYRSFFGRAVAGAGDVDADGFADAVVLGVWCDEATTGTGLLYRGSASGLPEPAAVLESAGSGWNSSAAAADIDADGYADVAVGTPNLQPSGGVLLYRGSAAGLRATPDAIIQDPGLGVDVWFGHVVAPAGDTDGDGYGDLLVSGWRYTMMPYLEPVRAFLYAGSDAGLAPSPTVVLDDGLPAEDGGFGYFVATAGDANGDGLSDVLVSSPNIGHPERPSHVFVFYGSPSGVSAAPSQRIDDPGWSYAVAPLGDVNGDGFDDISVGGANVGLTGYAGDFRVYLGSAAGLPSEPSQSIALPPAP